VAVFPPADIRKSAGLLASRVAAGVQGARIVPENNMHLTIRFLGEMQERDVRTFSASLSDVSAGMPQFRAGFMGLGAFPSIHKATALWAGLKEGRETFALLAQRVSRIFPDIGGSGRDKPLIPHLTLARFRAPIDLSRLEVFSELMETNLGMCTIAGFALMRSRLEPEGPVYEELCSCELKA